MKNHSVPFFTVLCALCMLLFGCQNQTSTKTEETAPTTPTTPEVKTIPENAITFAEANQRVDQYLDVYGSTGIQYLDGNGGQVILPRYFVVDAQGFSELLEGPEETLFASMNAVEQESGLVSNLIFHKIRPLSNGHLQELPDLYFDVSDTCPTNCTGMEGFEGNQIDFNEANNRVNLYNSIYGEEVSERFMEQNAGGNLKVVIARYYSFGKDDIQDILAELKARKLQQFYVSVGAVPSEEGESIFASDLIFHYVKPTANGHLDSSNDAFFDITKPCPKVCAE